MTGAFDRLRLFPMDSYSAVDFGSRMFIGKYTDLPVTDVPYIRLTFFLPPDSP